MQQGRVQLDADWNEQLEIGEHLNRTETRDVIGLCGAPIHTGGFRIEAVVAHSTGPDLVISAGRIYVDGILCEIDASPIALTAAPSGLDVDVDTLLVDGRLLAEGQWVRLREQGVGESLAEIQSITARTLTLTLDAGAAGFTTQATVERVTTYRTQPHLQDPEQIDPANQDYVAYIGVWQRHLTEVQEPTLREPALGGPDSGPDTTTRAQTVWQLRLEGIDPAIAEPECSDFGDGWLPAGAAGTAELRARAVPADKPDNECLVPAEAGYQGLEHQLYRVEIHADSSSGAPTFKWSRDNGSVVYAIEEAASPAGPEAKVRVSSIGRDAYFTIKDQDVVEVVDDEATLLGAANDLYRVKVDPTDRMVTLDGALPGSLGQVDGSHPLLRRWDHRARAGITVATDGAIEVEEDQWLPIEAGVEIMIRSGGTYHTGDFWLIPARAGVVEGVLWPTDIASDEGAIYQAAHGIERDHCVVGLVVEEIPTDCRPTFPPLTELELLGCCRRIEVGDDIQAAIDEAITNGGGCLCLARGVHNWSGELRIQRGRNISLHGEPGATLLLRAGHDGTSGISIEGSHQIEISSLFVTGHDVPWLVRVFADAKTGQCKNVDLSDLRMFNATQRTDDSLWSGAILATAVDHLSVDGCTIVARTGVMSMPAALGATGPDDTRREIMLVDRGISFDRTVSFGRARDVTVRDTHIHYFESGITAFAAHQWSIENSRLGAIGGKGHLDGAVPGLSAAAGGEGQALEGMFELLMAVPADPSAGRSAIESLVWIDSSIRDSHLVGRSAVTATVWARGSMTNCAVRTQRRGVEIGWLHKVLLGENHIKVEREAAIAFTGVFRSDIDENTIRAGQGIVNISLGRALTNLSAGMSGLARVGLHGGDLDGDALAEVMLWWALFDELTDLLGLRALIDAIDSTLTAKNAKFTILALLAAMARKAVADTDAFDDGPEAPVIDLGIDGNDIDAKLGISIQEFLPLGGLRIQDNRVLAEGEQAIIVNSGAFGRNPRLLGTVLRAVIHLVQTRLSGLIAQIIAAIDDPKTKQDAAVVVEHLIPIIRGASIGLARMLETNYRIVGNSARTSAVVIETNLYEATINANHVTQEQSLGFEVIGELINKFKEFDETRALAGSLAGGEPVYAEVWAYSAMEALPAEAFLEISRCIPTPTTPDDPPDDEPFHLVPRGLRWFRGPRAAVPKLFGGPAIWAKSPGVSITENMVLVPPDSAVRSWARGGILVKGDEPVPELYLLIVLAVRLKVELSSMSFMTETLVADNEVAGGYGHGVGIAETYLPLPARAERPAISLISEVRIANNQTRNMGGAGVVIDEAASAVGVDIVGNVVRDCSFDARIAKLGVLDTFGGIVGRNCAFVNVHGNRVSGCGDGGTIAVVGIDFEQVFQLTITDNTVIHSGGASRSASSRLANSGLGLGGINATLVMGALGVADNDVSVTGSGVGIFVRGILNPKDWIVSPILLFNVLLYLDATGQAVVSSKAAAPNLGGDAVGIAAQSAFILGTRAKITANQVTTSIDRTSFAIYIYSLKDLLLTGNLVRNLGNPTAAIVVNVVGEAVIGNNLADRITLGLINDGTIVGNHATLGISPAAPSVIHALNS